MNERNMYGRMSITMSLLKWSDKEHRGYTGNAKNAIIFCYYYHAFIYQFNTIIGKYINPVT